MDNTGRLINSYIAAVQEFQRRYQDRTGQSVKHAVQRMLMTLLCYETGPQLLDRLLYDEIERIVGDKGDRDGLSAR